MTLMRKNATADITESVLDEMKEAVSAFHGVFEATIAKAMKSKGHTIKYHRLSHVTDVIRRMGHLKEYDAQFYESANRYEKTLYKRTPGRQVNEQHLEGMVIRQRTQAMARARSTFDADAAVRHKQSAYITTSQTGEHTLVSTRIVIHTNGHTPNTSAAASKWLDQIPDFIQLRYAIASHCGIGFRIDDVNMPSINVGATAVLAASVPWEEEGTAELQTVRAVPSFHGKPYFDSVEIQIVGRSAFAQLRMLLSLKNPITCQEEELAFVKMYSRVRLDQNERDMLSEHGCIPLSWARASNCVRGTQAYRLLPLQSIIRRVYIVPDFSKPRSNRFHVCAFKWNRKPVENYLV
jgi:hypothetical protein